MTMDRTSATDRTLTLSPAEATLLRETLRNDLESLRDEIYKTENYEMRQSFKQREETFRSILERLGRSAG
jgi:hypothetical protein